MILKDSPFKDIIESQIKNKSKLNTKNSPPENGFTISILNNSIKHTSCNGIEHQRRKKQIINLMRDVLKKHKIKNCHININADKIPKTIVLIFIEKKIIHHNFYYQISDLIMMKYLWMKVKNVSIHIQNNQNI